MGLTPEEVRKVNLIEVLREDAEDEGIRTPDAPEYAYKLWSEKQIRAYVAAEGANVGELPAPSATTTRGPGVEDIEAKYPAPDEATFSKWFPGIRISGTGVDGGEAAGYVLCFSNAGSAEDVFTQQRNLAPATSPLLEWAKEKGWTVLAAQLPGRMARAREACLSSCAEVARQVLPLVASRLARAPYVVVAHSVGTWNAFEFLSLAREEGLPMPQRAFLGAFPPPSIPAEQRPWRRQADLGDDDFKDEARGWDVNEVVFSAAMWAQFGGLMRADFRLFDEYEYARAGAEPFDFPVTAFSATRDRKVTRAMVEGWQAFTSGEFGVIDIEGHHLFPLGQGAMKAAKLEWLHKIEAALRASR